MKRRWTFAATLFALALFPMMDAQVARADRDDHKDRDRHEYRHFDRDRDHRRHDWDRGDRWRSHSRRYYHRDYNDYYRGRIYDDDRWRIRFRVDPGYRYYDDYYDYRGYYSRPWWDGSSWRY